MEPVSLNTSDLVTVVGASAAAMILTQFVKLMFDLGTRAVRVVAMASGLAVLVVATLLSSPNLTALEMILAVIVGMQAGLAASAVVDSAREGLGYEVKRTEPVEPPPVVHGPLP